MAQPSLFLASVNAADVWTLWSSNLPLPIVLQLVLDCIEAVRQEHFSHFTQWA